MCEHLQVHSEDRGHYSYNKSGRQTVGVSLLISPLVSLFSPSHLIPGVAVMALIAERRAPEACGNTFRWMS